MYGLLKYISTSVKRAMQTNRVEVLTQDLFQTKLMNVQMPLDRWSQGEFLQEKQYKKLNRAPVKMFALVIHSANNLSHDLKKSC